MANGLALGLNPFLFVAIRLLTGRSRDALKTEGISAVLGLRRFAQEDVLGDAMRRPTWLGGLVCPVGADFVPLFPEAANGAWWLNDIECLSCLDGGDRAVSQRLDHLAVLLG